MKPLLTLFLLVMLALAACGPAGEVNYDATVVAEGGQEATATAPAGEATAVEPYPAPALPTPTPFPDDYPAPPTLVPTLDPYPAGEGTVAPSGPVGEGTAAAPGGAAPAGLVYEADEATWVMGAEGMPTGLAPRTGLEISPDGSQAAYLENEAIFVLNLETDEAVNVTEGSDRAHLFVTWWAGQPGTLLAGSQGAEDVGPNLGRLTLISADGSTFEVVGEEVSFGLPAGSPDGTQIAYDEGGQPFVYDATAGARAAFDAASFALPEGVTVTRAASPAWSPDGQALAWMMGIEREGGDEGEVALGLFDLAGQTAQVMHPYVPLGRGGWFMAPVWSPDGQWVLFPVETGDESRGLWVAAADGTTEQLLGGDTFATPLWTPDGSAALVGIPQQETMGLAQYAASTWQETMLELAHTRLMGWMQP